MHHAGNRFRKNRFRKSDRGATAIEYGLIAAGIAVAIAAAVFTLGDDVGGLFGAASDAVIPAEEGPAVVDEPQRLIDSNRGSSFGNSLRGNEVNIR